MSFSCQLMIGASIVAGSLTCTEQALHFSPSSGGAAPCFTWPWPSISVSRAAGGGGMGGMGSISSMLSPKKWLAGGGARLRLGL
jgi:hypothetical protein